MRQTSPAPYKVVGQSGLEYPATTIEQIDTSLRWCFTRADVDALLDRRLVLMRERDFLDETCYSD